LFDRPLTSNEYQTLLGVYDGDLAYADYQIGILLKTLHESKALDNTIIIISSDHGELLGEGRMVGHPSQPAEELLHVPCVMAGPGLNRGAVITSLTENTDLAPTLAALCRLNENHADFEGFSLTGLLRGSTDLHQRPYALSSLKLRFGHYAIHTGNALYVLNESTHTLAKVSETSRPEGSPPEWTFTPVAADEPLRTFLNRVRSLHLRYLTRPADCQYITLSLENIDAGCRSRVTSIGGAYPGQNEQPKNSWLLINDNLWCSSPALEPLRLRIPWNHRQSATVHALYLYGTIGVPPRVSLPEKGIGIIERNTGTGWNIGNRMELFTIQSDTDYLDITIHPPITGEWCTIYGFRIDYADPAQTLSGAEVEVMHEQLRALGYTP